ncbi:MAG: alpha/beta hydrolase [Clostridia bacterium]|nr:alpha/beta hydrolase [Clostridia bacterium]
MSKKLLTYVGALTTGVVAAVVAVHTVTKYLVKFALDREPTSPQNMQKVTALMAGDKKGDPQIAEVVQAAEKLCQAPCETVEIESHDGLIMVGHWYPCPHAKRILIAMHGWRSSWCNDFGLIADFWHDNQCSVLFAEQRGQGNSDGEYMGFGLMERHDCQRWAHWAAARGENLPIYLCGVSMGASTVLMSASLSMPPDVHGIIADCGFTSPHDIWKHVANHNLHLSYGIVGTIASDLCKKRIQIGTNDYSTIFALKETNIPVLFVHGTADKFVPITMTYDNYEACRAPKHLFVVPGAGHAKSYLRDKEGYQKAVLDFWQTYDNPSVAK